LPQTTSSLSQQLLASLPDLSRSGVAVLVHADPVRSAEAIARALHGSDDRRGKPFVTLLPTLLESETFDAETMLACASGGVLFIPDIGARDATEQRNLVRLLAMARDVDVQLVATADVSLPERVHRGEFPADVYYGLAGVRLFMAPAPSRRETLRQKTTRAITQALQSVNGDVRTAAGLLGVSRATVYRHARRA